MIEYEAAGWELAGNMRPDDWASPNKGNLIVRKMSEEINPLPLLSDSGKIIEPSMSRVTAHDDPPKR